jgi:lipid-A-disaccharide synthase-like uncharacterized protein
MNARSTGHYPGRPPRSGKEAGIFIDKPGQTCESRFSMIAQFFTHLDFWKVLGFTAQGLFFGRFFVQWLASERKGESTVPLAFWIFSVLGGSLLLVYAIRQRDEVFILGQAGGLVIYIRNLMLIYRKRRQSTPSPVES